MATLKQQLLAILTERYPKFALYPNGEKVLLAMSVLARDLQVRETRTNGGPQVAEILAASGLAEGYKWCAAAIAFAAQTVGVALGPEPRQAASVAHWKAWAERNSRIRSHASRGLLCFCKTAKRSHIGIVAGVLPDSGNIVSYEGNTSSGESRSQTDGDGLYRRVRKLRFWTGFIELDDL